MRYLLILAIMLLCSCGVFDNPLHLPEWAGHPADMDTIGQQVDPAGQQTVDETDDGEDQDNPD